MIIRPSGGEFEKLFCNKISTLYKLNLTINNLLLIFNN